MAGRRTELVRQALGRCKAAPPPLTSRSHHTKGEKHMLSFKVAGEYVAGYRMGIGRVWVIGH
jgi:hypothetical protein